MESSNHLEHTVLYSNPFDPVYAGIRLRLLSSVLRSIRGRPWKCTDIALRLIFYLTGVFWNIMDRLPAPYNAYIGKGNPIAFLLTSMRECLIYGQTPHRKLLLAWFLIGLVISIIGIRKIYKNENSYVKVI